MLKIDGLAIEVWRKCPHCDEQGKEPPSRQPHGTVESAVADCVHCRHLKKPGYTDPKMIPLADVLAAARATP